MPGAMEVRSVHVEALGWEYKISNLNDLRARGILSQAEFARKMAQSLERQRSWQAERRVDALEARAPAGSQRRGSMGTVAEPHQARNAAPWPRASSRRLVELDQLRAACPDIDGDIERILSGTDSMYWCAVVIQKIWRGTLTRLCTKAVVIQRIWRGALGRVYANHQRMSRIRTKLGLIRQMSTRCRTTGQAHKR
ncbi:hypothetical protein M885DRAFT_513372 [Pelagophyceae sp. CCMP2097]|nr:hypothetical protein M885DRAFT_513372 [Pelagophyceae sp. CCMP2097]